MKKHLLVLLLIFVMTIGFATLNTVLDLNGNIKLAENLEDFKIELSYLKINNSIRIDLISSNKQSFAFTGSGNDSIEYTVTNNSYQYDANITLVCTPNDSVTIEQVGDLSAQSRITKSIKTTNTSEITCTINVEKISRTDYAEDMCKSFEGTEWTFNYTGKEQDFISPCDGNYKVELWGASSFHGGKAGYTSGIINLSSKLQLFIYVGQYGNENSGGFNGGGSGRYLSTLNYYYGGGATDVRLTNGNWNNFDSLKSRIMVAAGSGSVNAGGLNGYTGTLGGQYSYGGTQNSGGTVLNYTSCGQYNGTPGGFGYGGTGGSADSPTTDNGSYTGGVGGGAGYYGGGGSSKLCSGFFQSAGGSSFISGHNGCNAITKESTSTNIIHTGKPNHYSGLIFTNTVMVDGSGYNWTDVKGEQTGMPTHDGNGTMTGNSGDGYAKITYLGK